MKGPEMERVYSYAWLQGTTASQLFRSYVRMMVAERLPKDITFTVERNANDGSLSDYMAIRMSEAELKSLYAYAERVGAPASSLVRAMILAVISKRYTR